MCGQICEGYSVVTKVILYMSLYLSLFWPVWQSRAIVEHNLSLSQNMIISWCTYRYTWICIWRCVNRVTVSKFLVCSVNNMRRPLITLHWWPHIWGEPHMTIFRIIINGYALQSKKRWLFEHIGCFYNNVKHSTRAQAGHEMDVVTLSSFMRSVATNSCCILHSLALPSKSQGT